MLRLNRIPNCYRLCIIALAFIFGMPIGQVFGQQIPISDNYVYRPSLMNPASVGTTPLNTFFLSHQQRKLGWDGWRSMSQFVNYSSNPLGRNKNFGAGFFINNDIEHTEQRISLNGAVSVSLVRNQNSSLSVGINAGILNWSSNYEKFRVFDRRDDLLATTTNFAELDAGAGIKYFYRNYFMRAEANAALSQLPGNFVSKYVKGINLSPHLMAGGNALFSADNNFYIGPLLFFRNTFFDGDTTLQTGMIDIGAKAEIDRWGLWVASAYRTNQSAITAGFGLKLINPDTLFEGTRTAYFLGMNAIGSYPMNESSVFGPSIELGLTLSFGLVGEGLSAPDTLQEIRGAFWKNEGNINQHKEKYLKHNAPSGLKAKTDMTDKIVMLTYEWDDNMFMYRGNDMEAGMDTLLRIAGQEWIGIDGVLGNMATEVAKDALYPDTINTQYPDSIERLRDFISIELNGFLRVDELAADFGAQGLIFNGDLPGVNPDSVLFNVIYNGVDTTILITKDEHITNLGLACLKLDAMRKRLEYEMNKQFGANMAFVWDGGQLNDELTKGRKVVYIKKPTITPNNPNQKPFMVSQIKMQFTRIPNYFEIMAANKENAKKNKAREKERNKGRNAYRDLVQ